MAGVACDHYRRYEEDFRLLASLGQNAHRLSIEWSRVEPSPGAFDSRQLDHYREVLADLRRLGMVPMLTLHHFTSPIWFAERGGWEAAGSAEAFLPFVTRVVEELGDLVGLWCTINEPNIYAAQGWLVGEFPPGRRSDVRGAWRVLRNLHRAHELAYQAIKQKLPQAQVGLAQHKWLMVPESSNPLDRLAAKMAQASMDRWPALSGLRTERVVAATSDYIGLNHYSGEKVAFDVRRPGQFFMRRSRPDGLPSSDFGWAVEPTWMRLALTELKPYGKPVYITENGIGAADDRVRERFLTEVLEQVWLAIQDGVDIRGYFHWTSLDNFEWAAGYSMRFGVIECDRQTLERRPKPSAHLLARIARSNALPEQGPEGVPN